MTQQTCRLHLVSSACSSVSAVEQVPVVHQVWVDVQETTTSAVAQKGVTGLHALVTQGLRASKVCLPAHADTLQSCEAQALLHCTLRAQGQVMADIWGPGTHRVASPCISVSCLPGHCNEWRFSM